MEVAVTSEGWKGGGSRVEAPSTSTFPIPKAKSQGGGSGGGFLKNYRLRARARISHMRGSFVKVLPPFHRSDFFRYLRRIAWWKHLPPPFHQCFHQARQV